MYASALGLPSHRSSRRHVPGGVSMISAFIGGGASDPGQIRANMSSILRAVRTHLGMEVGFISEFIDGKRVFRHVESAEGSNCVQVGASDPLEDSYCHWIAKGKIPRLIRDPADHPFAAKFAVTKSLPVGAHLSVPIRLKDGKVYGTFCCFSFRPDLSLTEQDLAVMEAFAQLAGDQIQQALDSDEERREKVQRIRSVLANRDLNMVYQPAIRLDKPRVAFVEALARFRPKPTETPDRWFAAAASIGLGIELETLAFELAIEGLREAPESLSVSINVSPETIVSPRFLSALESMPLNKIILEITEHDAVGSYQRLSEVLEPLRDQGLRIAIDDSGAGYSSFRHILQIRPDLIKLDMSLTRDVDQDPARHALASALIAFAREIGSELVAEGVETPSELCCLRDLGVRIVQGHIHGRPGPLAAGCLQ